MTILDTTATRPTAHVLDHGQVSLVRSMGDDLAIVNAAQASFDNESEDYTERERGILRSLIREEHGVPLEHATFTFKLRLPLFLAAQFKKHRMSSWSEHSARYSEMKPLFYVPEQARRQEGKAMEYRYSPMPEHMQVGFQQDLRESNHRAFARYDRHLKAGVSKEQARYFLPVSTYTTVVWTMNLRGLFNFLRLRLDPHAQAEARVYADAMLEMARLVTPDAIEAFIEFGYPKP